MKKRSTALLALTTAALGLPGIVPKSANAQAVPEKFTASYRFTEYQEDAQPAAVDNNVVVNEEVDRYDISVHQISIKGPASSNVEFGVDLITETLSGASPWYVIEGSDGQPVQIMSGATIEEERDEIKLNVGFYPNSSRLGFGLSYSNENDYEAIGANISNTLWLNDNNTTIDFGFSFSIDEINPTQEQGITRVKSEDKDSESVFLGLSQVINKTLLVGANVSYTIHDGFLSDPYKQVSVAGVLEADSRPDNRKQAALDLRLRKYLPNYATALHADYRFYDSSWDVSSHTLSLGAYKNIGTWQLVGRLRWYDQSAASFYRDFYTAPRADLFYSSDYRLSGYDALSFKVGLNKYYDFGTFYISYEDYSSTGNGSNPGLVDFNFFTIGLDYKF
ncbi:MAG: DUF3570 domain-containing protein [Pseudomonadota bacterium]